jgi:hypothetical protein
MNDKARQARVAGFFYLLLTVAAPLRLMYIPSTLFVKGDATATASNILAHETLFRIGIFSELFCGVVLIFLTLALFRLFKEVDRTLALLLVILGGILPATIDFLNGMGDSASLILLSGENFLSVFGKPQLDALVMLFLKLHQQQVIAAEILWGLWLFPMAALVIRSGFMPRFIGYWLILNGLGYLAVSVTGILLPQYSSVVSNIVFPTFLGEVAMMMWLLIMGVKVQRAA